MSFLLGGKNKGRGGNGRLILRGASNGQPPPGNNNHDLVIPRPRSIVTASSSGTSRLNGGGRRPPHNRGSGGGQSQVMLQRPSVATTMQKQPQSSTTMRNQTHQQASASASTTQEQQQQGEISLDEVMRDLRILEEQQRESQRKLEAAQKVKQRRQQQHATMETQLGEIKYANGQSQAELQRMRGILSTEQRRLSSICQDAKNAGDDLHDFDRKLRDALAAKRTLLSYHRTQHRCLEAFKQSAERCWNIEKKLEARVEQERMHVDDVQRRNEDLRRNIQEEGRERKSIANITAQRRAINTATEAALNEGAQMETRLKAELAECEESRVAMEERHKTIKVEMEERLETMQQSNGKMEAHISDMNGTIAVDKRKFHEAWNRHIQTQTDNGIAPSAPPSESTKLPILDLERILKSLEEETKAAADESKAKNELELELKSLQLEFSTIHAEELQLAEKSSALKASIEAASTTEKERQEEAKQLLDRLEHAEGEAQHLRDSIANMKSKRKEEEEATDKESTRLHVEAASARKDLRVLQDELNAVDLDIEKTDTAFEKAKKEASSKLASLEQQLASVNEEHGSILQQISAMEGNEDDNIELIEKLNADIDRFVQEVPILGTVRIGYDPSKTVEQQAKADLALIMRDCKKREASAQKMREGLEDAAKREKEERLKLRQASEEEKKRKEEARERRNQRLEHGSAGRKEGQEQPKRREQRKSRKETNHNAKEMHHSNKAAAASVAETESTFVAEESAAKPRVLDDSFAEASQTPGSSWPSTTKDCVPSTQKKVRWRDYEDSAALSQLEPAEEKSQRRLFEDGDHARSKNPSSGIAKSEAQLKKQTAFDVSNALAKNAPDELPLASVNKPVDNALNSGEKPSKRGKHIKEADDKFVGQKRSSKTGHGETRADAFKAAMDAKAQAERGSENVAPTIKRSSLVKASNSSKNRTVVGSKSTMLKDDKRREDSKGSHDKFKQRMRTSTSDLESSFMALTVLKQSKDSNKQEQNMRPAKEKTTESKSASRSGRDKHLEQRKESKEGGGRVFKGDTTKDKRKGVMSEESTTASTKDKRAQMKLGSKSTAGAAKKSVISKHASKEDIPKGGVSLSKTKGRRGKETTKADADKESKGHGIVNAKISSRQDRDGMGADKEKKRQRSKEAAASGSPTKKVKVSSKDDGADSKHSLSRRYIDDGRKSSKHSSTSRSISSGSRKSHVQTKPAVKKRRMQASVASVESNAAKHRRRNKQPANTKSRRTDLSAYADNYDFNFGS